MIKSKGSFLDKSLLFLLVLIGFNPLFTCLKAQNEAGNAAELADQVKKITQQLSNNTAAPVDTASLIQQINSIAVELLHSAYRQQALSFLNEFRPFVKSYSAEYKTLNYYLYTLLATDNQVDSEPIKDYLQLAVKSNDAHHLEMAYLLLSNFYLTANQNDKAELYLVAADQDLTKFKGKSSWMRDLMHYRLCLAKGTEIDCTEQRLINTIENEKFNLFQLNILEDFVGKQAVSSNFLDALILATEKISDKNLVALIYQKKADKLAVDDPEKATQLYFNSIKLLQESKADKRQFQDQLLLNWQQVQSDQEIEKENPVYWELFIIGLLIWFIFYIFYLLRRGKIRFKKKQRELKISIEQLSQRISKAEREFEERIKEREVSLKNELVEIAKLDTELKTALTRMEEANYLKNAFMANMSHEIRTPLNGILGFASLLGYELALLDKPELHEYASSIQKSGDKLLHLLNNIIDISRLQANDMEIKKQICHLTSLIESALEPLQAVARQKGIQIICVIPDEALALTDHETLQRVISEILDNSVKYTEKGYVKVSAEIQKEDRKIKLLISDTGAGIDKAFQAQIFEPFRQDNQSYSKQYQGAGLGLPLAKRLIDLLGGSLEILSEKAKGTNITLYLPQAEHQQSKEIIYTSLPAKPKGFVKNKLRLLLVEDDRSNLIVLSQLLKKYGQVELAADGKIALEAVMQSVKEKNYFDLFFMDINLPAPWDGIKLMHYIKENYKVYTQKPFVAQTAYGMAGDKERFILEGFNGYIAKPMKPDELALLIESLPALNTVK